MTMSQFQLEIKQQQLSNFQSNRVVEINFFYETINRQSNNHRQKVHMILIGKQLRLQLFFFRI